MKRILILGSQHGNELLGERLYGYVRRQPSRPELQLEYVLANPEARRARVRYIESDMNRSYTQSAETYEERLAQALSLKLVDHTYDIVIDAHTTTVNQAPCFIVPDLSDDITSFLRASSIKNIVLMKHEFIARSFIGNVRRALSLEISNQQLTEDMCQKLCQTLVDFAQDVGHYPRKCLFTTDGLILKSEVAAQDVGTLHNFQRAKSGYYPVLAGENSYKKQTNYLGFRAHSKQRIRI